MKYQRETRGQNFYALDVNLRSILGRIAPQAGMRWNEHLSAFGAWVGGEVDAEAAAAHLPV